jgi:hypothetical protein
VCAGSGKRRLDSSSDSGGDGPEVVDLVDASDGEAGEGTGAVSPAARGAARRSQASTSGVLPLALWRHAGADQLRALGNARVAVHAS